MTPATRSNILTIKMMLDTLMKSEGPYKVTKRYQISNTKQIIVAIIPKKSAERKALPNGTEMELLFIKINFYFF